MHVQQHMWRASKAMILGRLRTYAALAVGLSALPITSAHATDVGERLLREFENPYSQFDCDSAPVLERLKFTGCGFGYITTLPIYLAQREAARTERLEIEKARAWLWFAEPPIAENCNTIPELERAKFAYQCQPRAGGTDALGLLELNLVRLQNKREALAARVAVLRSDYERLRAREEVVGRLSPQEREQVAQLNTVLASLDRALSKQDAMSRFAFELQRNQVNLDTVSGVNLVVAPGGLLIRSSPERTAPELGVATNGDVVVLISMAGINDGTLMLVHPDYGLGYADRTEFYAQ